jgi:tryptophan-rich sensory protein
MQHPFSFLIFLLICIAVAAFGMMFKPGDWYMGLIKPGWTPPNWLFPPVWSLLYLMIAVAGWLAWQRHGVQGAGLAFSFYAVQLILNGLWSWLFFGLHRADLAFLDIVALWLAILGNLILFYGMTAPAGLLLVPYLLWVTYAGALNFMIWRTNIGRAF